MIEGWGRIAAGIAGGVVLLTVGAFAQARRAWRQGTDALVAELRAGAGPAKAAALPADLPAPVARYFAFALGSEAPVRVARVVHAGTFRTRPGGRASPFTSIQTVSVRPRGFVWDATIAMMPVVPVRIRDTYVGGTGGIEGRVGGLVPVVDQSGTPELAAGALARWLGEAVWLPSALLPGDGLAWEAIDDRAARATLTDRGTRVSMVAHFGPAGGIERITADRYRDVDGRGVLTPWIIELGEYTRTGGMMVPMTGSVAWELPEGRFEYWNARIVDVAYER
jgi:hypothetical protein